MYGIHEREFETKVVDVRKNCLDIVLNVGVFYITEAVIVKVLLFLVVEE